MIRFSFKGDPTRKIDASAVSKVFKGVEDCVVKESLRLVRYIKAEKLSDQVLHVRTGRLRRSITARFEGAGSGNFRAYVGTNVKYARVHEEGFNGTVTVPEYNVKEFKRMQTVAFGRLMKEPRMVTVRAHTVAAHSMRMNMPARPFLRPSLAENRESITINIREAIKKAMGK